MTDKPDLDAIEARCSAASPGPWDGRAFDEFLPEDAEFMTSARQDIPALTAALRAAWADNETLLREHNHALAVIREAS